MPLRSSTREEIAEVAVEREQLEAHLLRPGAVGVADIIGRRQADRDEVGRRRARRAACPRSAPAARASIAPSSSGEARNAAASPAARAKRPAPTGLPPPSIGMTCALAAQNGGGSSAGARRGDRRGDRRVGPRRRCRHGRVRQVGRELACRPSTSAGRRRGRSSSPPRGPCPRPRRSAGGPLRLHQLAERRHAQVERRDLVVRSRSSPARSRPRRNRPSCRRAAATDRPRCWR